MKFSILLTVGLTAATVAAESHRGSNGWRQRSRTRTRTGSLSFTRTRGGSGFATSVVSVPTSEPEPEVPEGGEEGEEGGEGEITVPTSTKKGSAAAPTANPGAEAPAASSTSTPSTPSTPSTGSGSVWQPAVGESWQIILSTTVDPSKAVAPDVSVFDIDMATTPKEVITALKSQGKKVICYFSAGSSEDFRSDNNQLLPYVGSPLDGWPGENWLDIRSEGVRTVMKARIAEAAEKGCDAIDPDNMDGYGNSNGLGLTQADTVDYVKFLSTEAATKGMGMGLKNAGEIIDQALPYVQFSVNEQCNEYNECDTFAKFIKAGKPVFNIEYVDSGSARRTKRSQRTGYKRSQRAGFTKRSGTCPSTAGFSSVVKKMDLNGWVQLCSGAVVTTSTSGTGKSG